jgi:hypothetical protein
MNPVDLLEWVFWKVYWLFDWLILQQLMPFAKILFVIGMYLVWRKGIGGGLVETLKRANASIYSLAGVDMLNYLPHKAQKYLGLAPKEKVEVREVIVHQDREVKVHEPSLWQQFKLFFGGGLFWFPLGLACMYIWMTMPK